jgi:hypothetical protein
MSDTDRALRGLPPRGSRLGRVRTWAARGEELLDRNRSNSAALLLPTALIGAAAIAYSRRVIASRPPAADSAECCVTGQWFGMTVDRKLLAAEVVLGMLAVLGGYYAYQSWKARKSAASTAPPGTQDEEEGEEEEGSD